MPFRSIGQRLRSLPLSALGLLCAGAIYVSLSFTSNVLIMQAKWSRDTRPDIAMAKLKLAAKLFPIQPQFREAPAYYAIYAQVHGLMSSAEALEEVAKALDFNINSFYLSTHFVRLGLLERRQ